MTTTLIDMWQMAVEMRWVLLFVLSVTVLAFCLERRVTVEDK